MPLLSDDINYNSPLITLALINLILTDCVDYLSLYTIMVNSSNTTHLTYDAAMELAEDLFAHKFQTMLRNRGKYIKKYTMERLRQRFLETR